MGKEWVIFILIYMCGVVSAFWSPLPNPTQLNPMDALAFIGDTMRITCTHPDFKDDDSQARFRISVNDNKRSWFLPRENQTSFANSTVQAYVGITEDFDFDNSWACFNGQNLLKSSKLYAERPLIDVSNVSAVCHSDHSNYVQFEWSRNSEYYLNPRFIDTKVFYSFLGIPKDWNNGHRCVGDEEVCDTVEYENAQGPFYVYFEVSHNLSSLRPGPNFLQPNSNTSLRSVHPFNLFEIIKTAPVTDVRIKEKDTTCANITWTLPFYFNMLNLNPLGYSQLLYQIQLITDEDNKFLFNGFQKPPSSTESVPVCGLTPHTHYSLTARVKEQEEHPWSDFSLPIQFMTDEDRPLQGPSVLPTGYHIESPCENDLRRVLVYWRNQPESTTRGKVIGFEINSLKETLKLRPSSNYFRTSLPCQAGTLIEIFTLTKIGPSLKPSKVYVPGIDDEKDLAQFSDIQFMVREVLNENREEKTLSVTWKPEVFSLSASQVNLTVYMCEESEPNTCFSEYEIEEMAAGKGQMLLKNISRSENLFGYSLHNNQGQKTGISWTDCVYQDGRVPPKPTGLQAIPGEKSGSVDVMWYNMRCNRKEKVLIAMYILSICPKNLHDVEPQGHESCQTVAVASSENSRYTFTNLQTGSYQVYLNAKSAGGLSPVATTSVTTTSEKIEDWKVILMSTFSCLLILAILIVCLIKYCCQHRKRIDKMKSQFTKLLDQPKEKPKTCIKNSDSGVYSSAATVGACTSASQVKEDEIPGTSTRSRSEVNTTSQTDHTRYSSNNVKSYLKQGTHVSLPKGMAKGQTFFRPLEKPFDSIEEDQGISTSEELETSTTQALPENIGLFPYLKNAVVNHVSEEHGGHLQNQSAQAAKSPEHEWYVIEAEMPGAEHFPTKWEDGYNVAPSGLEEEETDTTLDSYGENRALASLDGYKDLPFLTSHGAHSMGLSEDDVSLSETSDSDHLSNASSISNIPVPSHPQNQGYTSYSFFTTVNGMSAEQDTVV